MIRLGGQTLSFVSVTEDVNTLDDYGKPLQVRTTVDVPGCHFRSLIPTYRGDSKVTEQGKLTIDQWKATCPPVDAVLNATANDEVVFNGQTFHIIVGPRLFYTLGGRLFKITVMCEKRGG